MPKRAYALSSEMLFTSLKKASHIVLGLDYDGTLTPIAKRPELARLAEDTRDLIKTLSRNHKFTVSVISGRAINDIRRLVGLRNIYYAGNHGLEIYQPGRGILRQYSPAVRRQAGKINRYLAETLGHIKGLLIENKGITLSVHYRNAHRSAVPAVQRAVHHAKRLVAPEWHSSYGKKVVEIKPPFKDINKGNALKFIMRKASGQNVLPVFIGDDITDEDAFSVLRKKGISIYVGRQTNESCAGFYLRDVSDVKRFLKRIMEETKNDGIY
ncbi:MAG: trehalose-phosphatase [Planctomycetes bacterium]|nr:trehalose-phosphatase [Planctomycetota bacterium]